MRDNRGDDLLRSDLLRVVDLVNEGGGREGEEFALGERRKSSLSE